MSIRKLSLGIGAGALVTIASLALANSTLEIRPRDKCDPATFNAGTTPLCTGPKTGNVTLQAFLDAISSGGHSAWKFNPGPSGASIDQGGTVNFVSDGGETHTFTRVADFGGGIVPPFNAAVGNAPIAPECAAMIQGGALQATPQAVIVPAGSSDQQAQAGGTLLAPGEHHYQCCIHPWMRTTITVR